MTRSAVLFFILFSFVIEVKMTNAYDQRPRLYDENCREQRRVREEKIKNYKKYPLKYTQGKEKAQDSAQLLLPLDEEEYQESNSNYESDSD